MTEGAAPSRLTIIWSFDAQADLRAIDRQIALDILHCIDRYLATRSGDIKRLKPPMTGFRLRCGEYRISSNRPVMTVSRLPECATAETLIASLRHIDAQAQD